MKIFEESVKHEKNNNEKATIRNERQPNARTNIIDTIINLFAENNLSISESKEVLSMVLKRIESQHVRNNDVDEVLNALKKSFDKIT